MSLKDVFSIVYVGRLMIAKSAALSAISFPLISTWDWLYTNTKYFFFCLLISFLCDFVNRFGYKFVLHEQTCSCCTIECIVYNRCTGIGTIGFSGFI